MNSIVAILHWYFDCLLKSGNVCKLLDMRLLPLGLCKAAIILGIHEMRVWLKEVSRNPSYPDPLNKGSFAASFLWHQKQSSQKRQSHHVNSGHINISWGSWGDIVYNFHSWSDLKCCLYLLRTSHRYGSNKLRFSIGIWHWASPFKSPSNILSLNVETVKSVFLN